MPQKELSQCRFGIPSDSAGVGLRLLPPRMQGVRASHAVSQSLHRRYSSGCEGRLWPWLYPPGACSRSGSRWPTGPRSGSWHHRAPREPGVPWEPALPPEGDLVTLAMACASLPPTPAAGSRPSGLMALARVVRGGRARVLVLSWKLLKNPPDFDARYTAGEKGCCGTPRRGG